MITVAGNARGARRRILAILLTAASAAGLLAPDGAHAAMPTPTRVVRYAKTFIGVPYAWGATGPASFDCSGFTQHVFARFGIALPRTAAEQMTAGTAVKGLLTPGDLVFFDRGKHVGISIGNRRFISATVHLGVAVYSLRTWTLTQPFTTARRVILGPGSPPAVVVPPADSAETGASRGPLSRTGGVIAPPG